MSRCNHQLILEAKGLMVYKQNGHNGKLIFCMVSLFMQIYYCITAWSPTPPLQKVGEVYKLLQWVKLGILIYTWNFSVRPGRATTSLTMIYCNRFLISSYTGCSLNIVFLSKDFRIFRTLAFLCFPLLSVCVHTPGRWNTSDAAELTEFRKNTNF